MFTRPLLLLVPFFSLFISALIRRGIMTMLMRGAGRWARGQTWRGPYEQHIALSILFAMSWDEEGFPK
jgi:hypothetical protein